MNEGGLTYLQSEGISSCAVTLQEEKAQRGQRRLGAALLRKMGQLQSRLEGRRAYFTKKENIAPVTCFIFCLDSMHVFNVCFYFSLQAFFSLHNQRLF